MKNIQDRLMVISELTNTVNVLSNHKQGRAEKIVLRKLVRAVKALKV